MSDSPSRPQDSDRSDSNSEAKEGVNFVQQIIDEHNESGRFEGRVHTRFPPEPNGYLHIGHAKAICLNFGLAQSNQGLCNLRFDDTNPTTEDVEFVESIQKDIRWLGFDWEDRLFFASDYFETLYEYAIRLIKVGKAYMCSLPLEKVREYRGGWNKPGQDSPDRDRSIEENLDLFHRMRQGEFEEGDYTLRAKIDMNAKNMLLRDPTLYRIRKTHHHRTGDAWCIYPTYDFAHGYSDSIEGITHSVCTLEFENHRPLYDWLIDAIDIHHPQQIEFNRLSLTHTMTSKRKLLRLVSEGHVDGWDDPRMPTLAGMRRRGYTPESIRHLCARVGVSKFNATIDVAWLEDSLREHLNRVAPRVMSVLRPLKVVITNYPEGESEEVDAINNPEDKEAGTRKVPFSRELYIERDDFMEDPPKKFFRLAPGREVRFRYAYFITCQEVVKDPKSGEIVELRCTYDPATRGGRSEDGRKVKATLHWVSASHALDGEVRLYDHLFDHETPGNLEEGKDIVDVLNQNSLEVLKEVKLEPSLSSASPGDRFQFERLGYFCIDQDSRPDHLILNRSVTLKSGWKKKK